MTAAPGVTRFRELLARRLGWSFTDNDTARLDDVLGDRAAAHGLGRADYLHRLAQRGWASETEDLAQLLSITETYFFRHPEQFRALDEQVLPELVASRAADRALRLMSVGCSSGDEAYTMAILGRRHCPTPEWIVSVIGVDVNQAMLAKAAQGHYSAWSLRETPDVTRQRWFRATGAGYQITDEARAMVRFVRHNLVHDDPAIFPPAHYDVIFCRNVLMYLTEAAGEALVKRLTQALRPGGCLFLGHTDSLGTRPEGLEIRQHEQAFYYRCPTTSGAPVPRRPSPAAPASGDPPTEVDPYHGALTLLHAERFTEALDLLAGQPPGPVRPRDAVLRGMLLLQTGQIPEATAVARRLTENGTLYADAHQLYGLCLEAGHAPDEATVQYRMAAYLDGAFALPRLRLGQLARRHGDKRTTIAELGQALTLLAHEDEDRITLFGGGFGRIALTRVCRAELDACERPRR